MQRRAAAAYVAILVLVAAGAYSLVAVAEEPTVSLEDDEVDRSVTTGDTFSVGGTEYEVSAIQSTGGEDATVQATFAWNVTVEKTRTLENGSAVRYDGTNWTVETGGDASTVRLVEQNGTRTAEFAEGDAWNESGTVSNVTASAVEITYQGVEEQTTSAAEGENVTLGDITYTAHFPSSTELQLTTNYAAYQEELDQIDYFHERKNGLWAVAIISGLGGVLLLALAYLPNKGD
ncbi:MAG: hypothetical protein V5A37_00445 [Halobacteriales archaeon]